MNPQLIIGALQLLASFLPKIISGAAADEVTSIIAFLEQVIPVAIQVGEDLVQPIRNIISALRDSGALTSDQLDALDKQEAALDAAFDQAADAADAADKAAG